MVDKHTCVKIRYEYMTTITQSLLVQLTIIQPTNKIPQIASLYELFDGFGAFTECSGSLS